MRRFLHISERKRSAVVDVTGRLEFTVGWEDPNDYVVDVSSGAFIYVWEEGGLLPTKRPLISRNHVLFRWAGRLSYVCDLGSITGTFVNGERISNPYAQGVASLNAGDLISLGPRRRSGEHYINIRYFVEGDAQTEQDNPGNSDGEDIAFLFIP